MCWPTLTVCDCSGPRHRQPVYQWQVDWESQLPADVLQAVYSDAAAAAAAATTGPPAAADAAAVAAAAAGLGGYGQQWQGYQPAAAAAAVQQQLPGFVHVPAGAAAAASGHMLSFQSHYQNQQALNPGAAAAAAQAHPQHMQQQGLISDAAVAPDAMQQRLQQLDQLVNAVLAQHGEKTCVTLAQLKGLLQQLQAGGQEQPTAGCATQQQQKQKQLSGHADDSQDTSQDDQEQLDAAECLQQLAAGSTAGTDDQQHTEQQKAAEGCTAQEESPSGIRQPKRQKCCPDTHIPESSDQCCPGMTCFDLGAALRAAAAGGAAAAGASKPQCCPRKQQQEGGEGGAVMAVDPYLPAGSAAATTAETAQDESMEEADLNDGVHDHTSSGEQQNDEHAQDFTAFVAEEGEEAPGVRIGSNTLNNSREGADMQDLAVAAVAAAASLQQHQQQQNAEVEAAAVQGGKLEGRDSNKPVGPLCPDMPAPDQQHQVQQQQQHAFELTVPWVAGRAAEMSTAATPIPAAAGAAAAGINNASTAAIAQRLNPLLQAVQNLQPQQRSQLLTHLLESARRGAADTRVKMQEVQPPKQQQQQNAHHQQPAVDTSQQDMAQMLRMLIAQREGALSTNNVALLQQQQHIEQQQQQQQQHQQLLTELQKEQLIARLCAQQQQQQQQQEQHRRQQQQPAQPPEQPTWQALQHLQQYAASSGGGGHYTAAERLHGRAASDTGASTHQWLQTLLLQKATSGTFAAVASGSGGRVSGSLTAAVAEALLSARGFRSPPSLQQSPVGQSSAAAAASVVAAAAQMLAAGGPQAAAAAAALSTVACLSSGSGQQQQLLQQGSHQQQVDSGGTSVASGSGLDKMSAGMLLRLLQAQRR